MGRMSGCPAGASVSIRFDGSRFFRARHQDRPLIRPNGTREAQAITRFTRRLRRDAVEQHVRITLQIIFYLKEQTIHVKIRLSKQTFI